MELFQAKYKEEAIELIEEIEKCLLLMEGNFNNSALVEEIFRNMHNLKGNSSMFGFKIITDFTHHLESIYDLIRSGELKISRQILDLTFSSLDHLSLLINNDNALNDKQRKMHQELSGKVIAIIHGAAANSKEGFNITENIVGPANGLTTYHIHFKPCNNFFLNGSNPLILFD